MNDENNLNTPTDTEPKTNPPAPPADELAEYRNDKGEFDSEKIKKLVDDKKFFRSQIAKMRQTPTKIEEYGKDFTLDSKFDEFVSKEENKEKINKIFEKLDKLSLEKGLGVERNHDLRRFVLDELVDNKVIDLTPESKKAEEQQKIINERNDQVRAVIGEGTDIDAWNTNLLNWVHDFCNSEGEYKMHEHLIKTNSQWALSMHKVHQAMMGNRIPVAASEPNYNEAEWQRNFVKADRETQDKMLEERAKILTKNK